ncbi:type I-E CRISPR-associated protein Cse1/CasA [Enemella sp. A6]|uniref:type I-E CRISPR-associated protein Cse1/CasA n=1 Tax=Enemella sp. A6 TaxID=3440152 RepID=UPI003EBD3640
MSFNLLNEPWVPVIMTDGTTTDLSLIECFERAGEVRRISGDLPTQSFAILRVLLAICHDAIGFHDLDEVADLIDEGLPVDRVVEYLTALEGRFDLFDPKRPFFQVATLRTAKDEASPLNKLISDVPNGHPFMTTRGGEALDCITAAEAARWLIHAQAFDPSGIRSAAVGDPETSGGRGYPIGPSWVGQIGGIVLHGHTLAETLTYNICPTPNDPKNRPVWAQEKPHTERRQMEPAPAGPVELLVWQSRRIRLVGDRDGVTGVVLAQGDKMTPQNRQDIEHMTAWRYSKPQTKKFGIDVYMPLEHDPARSAWRGVPNLLGSAGLNDVGKEASLPPETIITLQSIDAGDADLPLTVTVEAVGLMYGPQNAVIEELVNDSLDLRLGILGEKSGAVRVMVNDAVQLADTCVWQLGNFASNLVAAAGDFDGIEGAKDHAMFLGWSAIDDAAREWLAGLSESTDTIEAMREWQQVLRAALTGVAVRLAADSSPAAVTGRLTKRGFMTAAKAESIYHGVLRKELPLAYPKQKEQAS